MKNESNEKFNLLSLIFMCFTIIDINIVEKKSRYLKILEIKYINLQSLFLG